MKTLLLLIASAGLLLPVAAPAEPLPAPAATPFEVAAHDHVTIEWWYVNTHLTTDSGRHLAIVASFFRFGSGVSLLDGITPQPRAHYLLYGVTDLDTGAHRAYSYSDSHMVASLRQLAPLMIAANPKDRRPLQLLTDLDAGRLPEPHRILDGPASVENSPFSLQFGKEDSLTAPADSFNSYTLNLGDPDATDHLHLHFVSEKPPMAVGGKGETGLKTATDMYYFSLTHCGVTGEVDTGKGIESVQTGQGWFDHQWGTSWVADNNGWDWWGVQLDNGEEVLFYRQRDLNTGRIFSRSATFMDAQGNQTETSNIHFEPDSSALWRDPISGTTFPLGWTARFPDSGLTLHLFPAVDHQAIPTLAPGGGIWEGSCRVAGVERGKPVSGVAYMELVGYESPAARAWVARLK